MNEWKRIFSDRRRCTILLAIPLLCIGMLFYQKWCDTFLSDPAEYRAMIDNWRGSTPEDIVATLNEQFDISENEMRIRVQAEYLLDYPAYLERVQEQAYRMQASSIFGGDPNSFIYRNIVKTAWDFEHCSGDDIRLGNYRAIQGWLDSTWADWGFLAAVVLLMMSFHEERKKGLNAVIRSCPGGRGKLQLSRLVLLLIFSAVMTMLLYYLPLGLSYAWEGGWEELSYPVQSLPEFRKCTAKLTIGEFLVQFFFLKTACGFLLGVLIWFALSFLDQVQLCWMVTAVGLVVEYFLYAFVPSQSIFSPLRYVNVFSYVFTSKLYTEYVNINFFSFPVGKTALLLGLMALTGTLLSMMLILLLPKRFPFGNRNRLGKWIDLWNQLGDKLRCHLGTLGFEWYKLLFLTVGGIILVLGALLSRNLGLNSGAYNRMEDHLYQQYVAQVQGPVTQATYDYIANAWAYLEEAQMNTGDFELALIRLEETIGDLPDGAWLVDDTMFMNIYGSESWYIQRNTALVALALLCTCLSCLFSPEQDGDLRKVLHSAPRGREQLFWAKYATALGVTFMVWLLVFVQEYLTASQMIGETVLSAPCCSIGMLKDFPGTVKKFLGLLCISKAVALLIPMHLCVFIGERCGSFEKSFLIGGITLLVPAVAYRFGGSVLQIATPISLLADRNVLFSGYAEFAQLFCWICMSLLALLAAKRNWCNVR